MSCFAYMQSWLKWQIHPIARTQTEQKPPFSVILDLINSKRTPVVHARAITAQNNFITSEKVFIKTQLITPAAIELWLHLTYSDFPVKILHSRENSSGRERDGRRGRGYGTMESVPRRPSLPCGKPITNQNSSPYAHLFLATLISKGIHELWIRQGAAKVFRLLPALLPPLTFSSSPSLHITSISPLLLKRRKIKTLSILYEA